MAAIQSMIRIQLHSDNTFITGLFLWRVLAACLHPASTCTYVLMLACTSEARADWKYRETAVTDLHFCRAFLKAPETDGRETGWRERTAGLKAALWQGLEGFNTIFTSHHNSSCPHWLWIRLTWHYSVVFYIFLVVSTLNKSPFHHIIEILNLI